MSERLEGSVLHIARESHCGPHVLGIWKIFQQAKDLPYNIPPFTYYIAESMRSHKTFIRGRSWEVVQHGITEICVDCPIRAKALEHEAACAAQGARQLNHYSCCDVVVNVEGNDVACFVSFARKIWNSEKQIFQTEAVDVSNICEISFLGLANSSK